MKKDNKKALYESIMTSVAKEVKKTLNESAGDGWDLDGIDSLEEAFEKIESFMYEVRNCVRGAYTNCYTYTDLADELRSIADSLSMAADDIENMSEPNENNEDEDDSWEGPYETEEERAQRDEDESWS